MIAQNFYTGKKSKGMNKCLNKYAKTNFMLNIEIYLNKENYETKIELDMVRKY